MRIPLNKAIRQQIRSQATRYIDGLYETLLELAREEQTKFLQTRALLGQPSREEANAARFQALQTIGALNHLRDTGVVDDGAFTNIGYGNPLRNNDNVTPIERQVLGPLIESRFTYSATMDTYVHVLRLYIERGEGNWYPCAVEVVAPPVVIKHQNNMRELTHEEVIELAFDHLTYATDLSYAQAAERLPPDSVFIGRDTEDHATYTALTEARNNLRIIVETANQIVKRYLDQCATVNQFFLANPHFGQFVPEEMRTSCRTSKPRQKISVSPFDQMLMKAIMARDTHAVLALLNGKDAESEAA